MSRALSANIRRLLALAALGVFWAALLAAVGVSVLVVAGLVAAVLVVAALGLEGRHLARKGPLLVAECRSRYIVGRVAGPTPASRARSGPCPPACEASTGRAYAAGPGATRT